MTAGLSGGSAIYDDDFEPVALQDYTKQETRLYLEHGITDWLTFVGNTGLQEIRFRSDESAFDYSGFDRTELGLQGRVLSKEGLALSLRASYVIDGGPDTRLVDVLPGGDAYELRALLGLSRETLIGDVFQDLQIAARTGDGSRIDNVRAEWTLGIKPTHRTLIMAQAFASHAPDDRIEGFRVPSQLQVTGQVSVARQIKPGRYLQLGVGHTLVGRNIVRETSLNIGLWTEY